MNLKQAGRKALTPALGKTKLQPLWEALHQIALAGQNFGEGNHPGHSGERDVMELVAQRFDAPLTIFDVGANQGQYTSELLEVFNGSAQIWAFEPNPANVPKLEQATVGTGVQVRGLALGDRPGKATLYIPGSNGAKVGEAKLASLYDTSDRMARYGMHVETEQEVEVTTLDAFCQAEGIDQIHLLKLDVEGHELAVLQGAERMLGEGRVDAIQWEFAAANMFSRVFFHDFWQLLNEHYQIHRVLQDGLWPVDSYKESYEVFKRATNYLALRRSAG